MTQLGASFQSATGMYTLYTQTNTGPEGMSVGYSGEVYIAESSIDQVWKWTPSDNSMTPVITSGLNYPQGIYSVPVPVVPLLYIVNTYNVEVDYWIPNTLTKIDGYDQGLDYPTGITLDPRGSIFVVDQDNFSVFKIMTNGSLHPFSTFTTLTAPFAAAADFGGNIFVSSAGPICKLSPPFYNATSYAGALGPSYGLAVDVSGNVYYSLAVPGINEGVVGAAWAKNGTTTLVSSHGNGLNAPRGLAVDKDKNLYIADTDNDTLREIPRAFIDTSSRLELDNAAGSDVLPAVMPTSVNLGGVFTPTSDQSWLTVNYTSSGVIHYSWSSFAGPGYRTAHINVLGRSVTIAQGVPAFSLNTTNVAVGPSATSNTVSISVAPTFAPITATANNSWLHIVFTNNPGSGSAIVTWSYDDNLGPPRAGTLTVCGITLNVSQSALPITPPLLTGTVRLANGGLLLSFTNNGWNTNFTALCSSNLTLPLTNWIVLSPVTNSAPGTFQFTAPPAPNSSQMFYIIRSP